MDRLETRELAYFVAVAEELHFGRAARRLGIAQPPLSRAIQRLERRLGVTLIDRSARAIALTPAGETLLHEGRAVLDGVTAAARRTRRAAAAGDRLVVALKAGGDGGLLPEVLAANDADPHGRPVDLLFGGVGEPAAMLRDGRADVGLLHRPPDDLRGFDTEELLVEPMVVALPAGHRLAGRSAVRLADLAGETFPSWQGGPGQDGGHDAGQIMQLVALGRMVAVLPASITGQLRRDLVAVAVTDATPSALVIAWPERSRSRAAAAFVRAATAVAARRLAW